MRSTVPQKLLSQQKVDRIETAGIKVPDPVLMSLYLIEITIIASRISAY